MMSDIVKRLRLSNDHLLAYGVDYSDLLLNGAIEIERLRKALASSCDEQRQLYREEANWPCEAAMDNEVLRELLRDILEAEDLPAHWWLRIREALREKP